MTDDASPGSTPEAAAAAGRLRLPASLREQILIHLLQAAPNEGVGLLAVAPPARDEADVLVVDGVRFFPGTNVDASPTRFTMDPAEVLAAFREMREAGWELGAIVHSHLSGPPRPSPTDLREAHYPDALMLIVSFADQPATMRAWRVVPEHGLTVVQPVPIEILRDR